MARMTRRRLVSIATGDPERFTVVRTPYGGDTIYDIIVAKGEHRGVGVRLWPNGIHRNDVALALAKNMTVTEAAKVLGIGDV